MATENTHSDLVVGPGGTAAARTSLGTITLPAGGPWTIHNVFGLIARATATAAQSVAGYIELVSTAGDIDPNPAPSKWPLVESGSSLGATMDVTTSPLQIYSTNWQAAGKAVIELFYVTLGAVTVAPRVMAGIMFGKAAPELRPLTYSENVRAAVTTAVENTIGTITISERATRITGICAYAVQNNVLTTAEELLGHVILRSDDLDLTPMRVPFLWANGAGLGALIDGGQNMYPYFLPLDIPVVKGARIVVSGLLNTAVTNAAEVNCFIAYE